MAEKRLTYRERFKILRSEAEGGSARALEELYQRYHVNKMMINGQLVDLKRRLQGTIGGFGLD